MGRRLRLLNRWVAQRLPWRRPKTPRVPRPDLFPKVKEILISQFDVPPDSITAETHLTNDLTLDSLDFVEFTMCLEETFGLEIPDEDAEELTTMSELLRYLEDRTN